MGFVHDLIALEALSQRIRLRLDGIGAVGQDAGLSPSGVGCLQADIVFGIGPIDADEGGEFVACRLRLHGGTSEVLEWKRRACLSSTKAI
jgi:hypothetical protein